MATTLAQVQKKIAKLEREAATLKKKEAGDVIRRIKTAIEHYGLVPADLFTGQAARAPAGKKSAKKPAAKKSPSPIRFRDEAGHTWTGHGKRPNWYKAALEAGKKPEDLAV